MTTAAPLEVRSLTKRFALGNTVRRSYVYAVDDVSFELRPGTITALVGESGSGKSTVARLLAHLYEPSTGEVLFEVSVDDPPSIGGLLGTESKAYLTSLAATRSDPPRQAVPLSGTCGRYVDWHEVAPGTPASALHGVPAPHPQPVEPD